jgi:hypothetical protein
MRAARISAAAVTIVSVAASGAGGLGYAGAAEAKGADRLGVRAKRACLRDAGIRTTVRRRKKGDDDAPDAVLTTFARGTGFGRVTAFVGLYADLRRARRYEPEVRAGIEAVGGAAERRGTVTIAWVRPPGPRLRRTVRRCVYERRG